MESERRGPTPKELKDQRHNENLRIFTGRHRGTYYDQGVANPHKFLADLRNRSRLVAAMERPQ